MDKQRLGKWILSAVAASMIPGGVLADWNRTHLFNPRWPPHAKFHDAWTMLLAAGIGIEALYLLWRRRSEPDIAATLLALVGGSQAASHLFPGAGGVASEFPEIRNRPGLAKIPEIVASSCLLTATAAGWCLLKSGKGAQPCESIEA